MATKTISIDIEAYERLQAARQKDESFSQVIKRTIRKRPDIRALFRDMDRLSDSAVNAVERQVSRRNRVSKRQR